MRQMEADVILERAVALASGCMLLGMRLYASDRALLGLLIVTTHHGKPLRRYLATTYLRGDDSLMIATTQVPEVR